jgi:hypothetical protein
MARSANRMKKPKRLSGKQVLATVTRRLQRTEKLNFLEHFAMFMGKAQVVELGLKKILVRKYGYKEEKIENWPLGAVIKELKKLGLRRDFIALVEHLKEHRNYIAHEMLADDAMMQKLAGAESRRFAWKSLERGLFSVEEGIVVHDFLASNELL